MRGKKAYRNGGAKRTLSLLWQQINYSPRERLRLFMLQPAARKREDGWLHQGN
jgi:hypothetical protein